MGTYINELTQRILYLEREIKVLKAIQKDLAKIKKGGE